MKSFIKNSTRAYIGALVCLAAFLAIGCQQAGPKHDAEVSHKLSTNTVLKKGWTTLPIPIFISETVPEKFRSALIDALEMWNFEAGTELFIYQDTTPSQTQEFDGMNALYWDENPNEDSYFGKTFLQWYNETVIVEADIVFFGMPEDFDILSCKGDTDVCKSPYPKKDIVTTALHELGHVLGFVHTNGPNEIMNPNFSTGDVLHHFDENLVSELISVYNPTYVAKIDGDSSTQF